MAMKTPTVAILILNWNDARNTLETLESVRSLRYEPFNIVLIDNGSSDGSARAIADRFPDITLVASPENLGVAGGRNFGLQAIFDRGGADYVLFLDNDIAVEALLLDKLVAVAEAQAGLGIVGPVIYYHSDPGRVWDAGKSLVFRHAISKVHARNRVERQERPPGIQWVDCISGCCMLVKRKVFETIGFFDTQFFLVADDTDFCVRAAKRGFASAVVNHAKLWHKVSSSTGSGYTPARTYFTGRSTSLFLKAHGRPWHWVKTFVWVALALPVAYLREWRRGNQRAVAMKFRGYLDGLLGRPVYPEVKRYFHSGAPRPGNETRD